MSKYIYEVSPRQRCPGSTVRTVACLDADADLWFVLRRPLVSRLYFGPPADVMAKCDERWVAALLSDTLQKKFP